jgi:hypothetical protein
MGGLAIDRKTLDSDRRPDLPRGGLYFRTDLVRPGMPDFLVIAEITQSIRLIGWGTRIRT